MNIKQNIETSESIVLKALESMGAITSKIVDKDTTGLYKDGAMFGLIVGSDIYLRSEDPNDSCVFQGNKFAKVQFSPEEKDDFLKISTRAYWLASGKVQA